MRRILACIPIFILGCNDMPKQNEKRLSINLIDSLEAFVKYNIDNNLKSEYHLMYLESGNKDSLNYILTSITESELFNRYRNVDYVVSDVDSSVIIIDDKYELIDVSERKKIDFLNHKDLKDSINTATFNPIIWRMTIINDSIIIDKLYGQKKSQEFDFKPKVQFKVPRD